MVMFLGVGRGLTEHGLGGNMPNEPFLQDLHRRLPPQCTRHAAGAMELESMIMGGTPGPQVPDSVLMRWLLGEAQGLAFEASHVASCSSPVASLDTPTWTSPFLSSASVPDTVAMSLGFQYGCRPPYHQTLQVGQSMEDDLIQNADVQFQENFEISGGQVSFEERSIEAIQLDCNCKLDQHSFATSGLDLADGGDWSSANSVNASFCASPGIHSSALSSASSGRPISGSHILPSGFPGTLTVSPVSRTHNLPIPTCGGSSVPPTHSEGASFAPALVSQVSVPTLTSFPSPPLHYSGSFPSSTAPSLSFHHQVPSLVDESTSCSFNLPSMNPAQESSFLSGVPKVYELSQPGFISRRSSESPCFRHTDMEPPSRSGFLAREQPKEGSNGPDFLAQGAVICPSSSTAFGVIPAIEEWKSMTTPPQRRRVKAPHKAISPSMKRVSEAKPARRLESLHRTSFDSMRYEWDISSRSPPSCQLAPSKTCGQDAMNFPVSGKRWGLPASQVLDFAVVDGVKAMPQERLLSLRSSSADSEPDDDPDISDVLGQDLDGGQSLLQGFQVCPFNNWEHDEFISTSQGVQIEVWQEVGMAKYKVLQKVAEAVDSGNVDAAKAILARLSLQVGGLSQHPYHGKGNMEIRMKTDTTYDRVACLFREALSARITGMSSLASSSAMSGPLDFLNHVRAFKSFCEVSPIPSFAYFTANQAILESMEGEASFHIVDFQMGGSGTQWASLLFEMAHRAGLLPVDAGSHTGSLSSCASSKVKLRLTMVGMSNEEMKWIGDRLGIFARELNVELAFHPIVIDRIDSEQLSMLLQIEEVEPVAVNFVFSLHWLLDEGDSCQMSPSGAGSSFSSNLKSILDWLAPKVVTVVEKDASLNSPSFPVRFSEALQYYTHLFHSIEASVECAGILSKLLERDFAPEVMCSETSEDRNTGRTIDEGSSEKWNGVFEKFLFAPEIGRLVGCQGLLRVERYETTQQWRQRLESSGLRPRLLGSHSEMQARCLLKDLEDHGFAVTKKDGSLVLAWDGHPLVASSAWVCL